MYENTIKKVNEIQTNLTGSSNKKHHKCKVLIITDAEDYSDTK